MATRQIGTVTHYFGKLVVGIVALTGRVTIGDRLHFLGHGADFQQKVKSLEIDHAAVENASAKTEVGIRLSQRVREGTKVYKVSGGSEGWFARLKGIFTG